MPKPKHLTFAAGEKRCEICKKDLPAFTCRRQRKHFYCHKYACRSEVRKRTCFQVVAPKTRRCAGPKCTNFAPGGKYDPRQRSFYCSDRCLRRHRNRGQTLVTCGLPGCGKQFYRRIRSRVKNHFCCYDHIHKYRSARVIKERAGHFMPLLEEYIQTYARIHYRKEYGTRNALSYFFQFLNERGIRDVNDVTPKTITGFVAWESDRGITCPHNITFVSTFFNWLIDEERRSHANPVVPRIHRVKRPKLLPRPYSEQEIAQIWSLLEKRGNNRLRLAQAIAEEAGLRAGEICNIRLSDVDLKKQTIFVRLPNKGNEERTAMFHERTKKYLAVWLKERNKNCGHDHLLHNTLGRPLSQNVLQLEFARVLCKKVRGKTVNQEGLDRFSLHRSRHTMATRMAAGGADANAIMRQGGWRSASAMCGYTQISNDRAVSSYNQAMERAAQNRNAPRMKSTNFKAFVQGDQAASQPECNEEDRERCA
jgi:integrase/recombinase XerC